MTEVPILTCLPGERRGYVDGPAGQVHYREIGEGRPLLLGHQAPWASIQYSAVMPLLAARGFRVIVPDMPGAGMSNSPQGLPTMALFADSMAAVLDGLGIDQVVAAGHHGGALAVARLAAAHPERVTRIAFDNAPMFTVAEWAERSGGGPPPPMAIRTDGSHLAERFQKVRARADPAWTDATVQIAVVTYFHNGPWCEHSYQSIFSYDFLADLPLIRCPTLVIASKLDPIYEHGRKIIAVRPDFEYAEFATGTGTVFETPEAWVDMMAGFLGRDE